MHHRFCDLLKDRQGAAALLFSIALPAVLIVGAASMEYGALAKRRAELQKAADAAALAATAQLGVAGATDSRIEAVAKAIVLASAGAREPQARIAGAVLNNRTWVRVSIEETVDSLVGKVLSAPSWTVQVQATGQLAGKSQLCMLSLDAKNADSLHLHKSAVITANGCTVQSNSTDRNGLHVEDNASVTADKVCSSGGYKGGNGAKFSRAPITDCPTISDPLAAQVPPPLPSCTVTTLKIDGKITPAMTLLPGVYCGGIKVTNNAKVTLLSGIYVIDNGPLVVDHGGSLTGTNVGFYFTGDKGGLLFDVDSTITLTAPKDGIMAGLLFFENRMVSAPIAPPDGVKLAPPPPPPGSPPMRTYRIVSNNARTLLGTIYLPAGRLIIDADKPVADLSAYTVIVARQVELFDGPNLYLNTNYAGSDVPVPSGVGPISGASGVALVD